MNKNEQEARKHRCPRCGAQSYFSCVRYKGIKPISLAHPHSERVALVQEEPDGSVR